MIAYGKEHIKRLMDEDSGIIKNMFLVYENSIMVAICDTEKEAEGLCSALKKKGDAEYTYRHNTP